MDRERFDRIFDNDDYKPYPQKDRIFAGLEIIKKYLPDEDIGAAEHDIVYAADCDELIKAGITEEDAIMLEVLGWHIEEESLAHFV